MLGVSEKLVDAWVEVMPAISTASDKTKSAWGPQKMEIIWYRSISHPRCSYGQFPRVCGRFISFSL